MASWWREEHHHGSPVAAVSSVLVLLLVSIPITPPTPVALVLPYLASASIVPNPESIAPDLLPPPPGLAPPKHRQLVQGARGMESIVEPKRKPSVGYWAVKGAWLCDVCAAEPARLHCRVDGAFLCHRGVARVNGAGSSHECVWLSEVCEHALAAVTCCTDAAALYTAYDTVILSDNPAASFLGVLTDSLVPRPFPSSTFAAAADSKLLRSLRS